MSERIYPIGDSTQAHQGSSSEPEQLNLLKLVGPSGKDMSVLPIQIDDPGVIQRAMNMNIYGQDQFDRMTANASKPSSDSTGSTSNSAIFDRTVGSTVDQSQPIDFSPVPKSTAASNADFDIEI